MPFSSTRGEALCLHVQKNQMTELGEGFAAKLRKVSSLVAYSLIVTNFLLKISSQQNREAGETPLNIASRTE